VGRPITEPQCFEVKVRLDDPRALGAIAARIEEVACAELARIGSLWRVVLEGAIHVW
jgi:S-adenosylmethionine synthetase